MNENIVLFKTAEPYAAQNLFVELTKYIRQQQDAHRLKDVDFLTNKFKRGADNEKNVARPKKFEG